MMTKWDTIQEDVKDAYIGVEELIAWEESEKDLLLEQLDERDENFLTLVWEMGE